MKQVHLISNMVQRLAVVSNRGSPIGPGLLLNKQEHFSFLSLKKKKKFPFRGEHILMLILTLSPIQ